MTSKTVLKWSCRLRKVNSRPKGQPRVVPCHNTKSNWILEAFLTNAITFAISAYCINMFVSSVTQQTFMEHSLCARPCSQLWRQASGQKTPGPEFTPSDSVCPTCTLSPPGYTGEASMGLIWLHTCLNDHLLVPHSPPAAPSLPPRQPPLLRLPVRPLQVSEP